jgi:hypothetical protein
MELSRTPTKICYDDDEEENEVRQVMERVVTLAENSQERNGIGSRITQAQYGVCYAVCWSEYKLRLS